MPRSKFRQLSHHPLVALSAMAVLVHSGCRPATDMELMSNYGTPINLPEPTLQETWADFAHECDWRVFGPGRVRETSAEGNQTWRQVSVPSLQNAYSQMKESPLWEALELKVNSDRTKGVELLLTTWTGQREVRAQLDWIQNDAKLWRDERDLIPLLLIELHQSTGSTATEPSKSARVSPPPKGVLENYCSPGQLVPVVEALLRTIGP